MYWSCTAARHLTSPSRCAGVVPRTTSPFATVPTSASNSTTVRIKKATRLAAVSRAFGRSGAVPWTSARRSCLLDWHHVLLEEVGRPYGLPYDPIIRGDDGGQCLQVSTSPEFLKDV